VSGILEIDHPAAGAVATPARAAIRWRGKRKQPAQPAKDIA
jgi:hypothetical protein